MRETLKRFRLMALFLATLMLPAPSWAATGDMPVMIAKAFAFANQDSVPTQQPEIPKANLPQLRLSLWNKLGERPFIPDEIMPPRCRTTDTNVRWLCHKDLANGAQEFATPEYKPVHRLYWSGWAALLFAGPGTKNPDVPDWFREALLNRLRNDQVSEQQFGHMHTFFPCGMVFGGRTADGQYYADKMGNPRIMFEEPKQITVYMLDPILMLSGPYQGHPLAMVIPADCINLTCMDAVDVTEVLPKPPPPPPPTMAEVKIKKDWKKVNGKKADTPSRDDVQLRFEIAPQEGGEAIRVESWDNKEAKAVLEAGKTYTIREYLDSDRWRSTRDSVTFTVDEKRNKEIVFENIEVPVEEPVPTAAAGAICTDCPPGLPGRDGKDGRDGRDGKGVPKWIKWGLPIAGAIAGAALFLPRGNEGGTTNVYSEPCKGSCSTNPGGR